MPTPSEEHRFGLVYLDAATALLRRVREAHPTKGSFEAADLQWRWRTERSTDSVPQLFWFDEFGQPVAAAILTDWGGSVSLDPLLLPDSPMEWVAFVVERALHHAAQCGFDTVELEVDRADACLRSTLAPRGFVIKGDGVVETWLGVDARPAVSALPQGYLLVDRARPSAGPHHMARRSGAAVETRLRQTSLYRPDLDLAVLVRDGSTAAYGLFWFDPVTATGLVEPMRTEDDHQRRGLARHVLTTGVERLADAGATRIKICYEPTNPASSSLYLSVGFRPTAQTDRFVGPTSH